MPLLEQQSSFGLEMTEIDASYAIKRIGNSRKLHLNMPWVAHNSKSVTTCMYHMCGMFIVS